MSEASSATPGSSGAKATGATGAKATGTTGAKATGTTGAKATGTTGAKATGPTGPGALRSLALPLALGALAGPLAVAAALGFLPAALAPLGAAAAAWLAFGGGALPLVALRTPDGASPAKLFVVSALLSPPLAAALWIALRLAVPTPAADAGTWFLLCLPNLFGALGALGSGRAHGGPCCRVRLQAGGRAWRLSVGLALLAGLAVALFLFRGSAARVSFHGLLHSSVLGAVERSVPPENPWMAGTSLVYYWFWHALAGLLGRGLALAPTRALALTNLWAALLLVPVLYFTAAAVFHRGGRVLLGVLLALLGLNVIGGYVWLTRGMPFTLPTEASSPIAVFDQLAGALVFRDGSWLWDRRLAWSFSKFGNLSSYPSALVLAAGAWMAALHAVRGSGRPWPGLAGALGGAALAVNPVVGGAAVGVTALGALCFAATPRARADTLVQSALWALPGAALVALASRGASGPLLHWGWREGALGATLLPVLPLLLLAAWAWLRPAPVTSGRDALLAAEDSERSEGSDRQEPRARRRAALGLLFTAGLVPLLGPLVLTLPEGNEYKWIRMAALPLGLLAGGGFGALVDRGGARRILAGTLGAATLVGALALTWLGGRAYLAFGALSMPLAESPAGLLPAAGAPGSAGEDLRRLYAWIRTRTAVDEPRPVLLVNSLLAGPVYGSEAVDPDAPAPNPRVVALRPRFRGGRRFTGELNLQGHEAPAFSGTDLWCDRKSYMVEHHPRWELRLSGVAQLYRDPTRWDEGHRRSLESLERPILLLVTNADREDQRMIDKKVQHYGYREVLREETAALFAWPPEYAEAVRAGRDPFPGSSPNSSPVSSPVSLPVNGERSEQ